MSDMLQLVVAVQNAQLFPVTTRVYFPKEVEFTASQRQAEAYRTLVEQFLSG
jgi:hypothetical protein